MDEAGLPEESMESLKVSTYITNTSFINSVLTYCLFLDV